MNINTSKNSNKIEQIINFKQSLSQIDVAIEDYVVNVIRPFIWEDQQTIIEVPIFYATGQRWYQLRKQKFITDHEGVPIHPLLTFKRTSISKRANPSGYRLMFPNEGTYFKRIKRRNRKDVLQSLKKDKGHEIEYEIYNVIFPILLQLNYQFIAVLDNLQHTNSLIQQFANHDKRLWNQNLMLMAYIEDFSEDIEMDQSTQRLIKLNFGVKFTAAVIPDLTQTTIKHPSITNIKISVSQKQII